jgi:hypothetical protein
VLFEELHDVAREHHLLLQVELWLAVAAIHHEASKAVVLTQVARGALRAILQVFCELVTAVTAMLVSGSRSTVCTASAEQLLQRWERLLLQLQGASVAKRKPLTAFCCQHCTH